MARTETPTAPSKHAGCEKTFCVLHAYGPGDRAELAVGFSHPEGGSTGEFIIRWLELGGTGRLYPQICIFSDAWDALAEMPELFQALKPLDDTDPSIETLVGVLAKLGYRDTTRPAPAQNTSPTSVTTEALQAALDFVDCHAPGGPDTQLLRGQLRRAMVAEAGR